MSILMNAYDFETCASTFLFEEEDAVRKLEEIRWKKGPVCPFCNSDKRIYNLKSSSRIGLKKCGACYRTFNVRTNTIFMESRIPLYKWLQYIYLFYFANDRTKISDYCMIVNISYKTSWSMSQKLRSILGREYISRKRQELCSDVEKHKILRPQPKVNTRIQQSFFADYVMMNAFIVTESEFNFVLGKILEKRVTNTRGQKHGD